MFRDQKLCDAFPPTTGYHFEKLFEAIRDGLPKEIGLISASILSENLEKFAGRLAARNLVGVSDDGEYYLNLIGYPLEELVSYFSPEKTSKLTSRDAFIFADFVQSQMKTLIEIAAEIDQDYDEKLEDT